MGGKTSSVRGWQRYNRRVLHDIECAMDCECTCGAQADALTVGSLFTGIAGIDAGLEACGLSIAWQCERDDFRRRVLQARYPETPCYDDVRTLPTGLSCDVLAGGSPCQDLAAHGSRQGLDGARSGLWWAFLRTIEGVKPGVVFFENVANILRSRDGSDFSAVLEGLAGLGFDAVWCVLRASDAGLTHQRRRLFLLAHTREGRLALQRSAHHDDGGQPFGNDADRRDAMRPPPPGPGDVRALQAWVAEHDGPLPGVRRDAARIPDRVDRVAALGDTAPPPLVALAWRTLRDLAITG